MFPSRNLPTKPPGTFPWSLEFCSESTHRFQTQLRSLRASGSLYTWFPQLKLVSIILAQQVVFPLRAIGFSLKCHPQEGFPLTLQLKVGHVPSLLFDPSFLWRNYPERVNTFYLLTYEPENNLSYPWPHEGGVVSVLLLSLDLQHMKECLAQKRCSIIHARWGKERWEGRWAPAMQEGASCTSSVWRAFCCFQMCWIGSQPVNWSLQAAN